MRFFAGVSGRHPQYYEHTRTQIFKQRLDLLDLEPAGGYGGYVSERVRQGGNIIGPTTV